MDKEAEKLQNVIDKFFEEYTLDSITVLRGRTDAAFRELARHTTYAKREKQEAEDALKKFLHYTPTDLSAIKEFKLLAEEVANYATVLYEEFDSGKS